LRVGFFNDFEVVEACYWDLMNYKQYPDPGGSLDQDTLLMNDIRLYGWWYQIAKDNVQVEVDVVNESKGRQR